MNTKPEYRLAKNTCFCRICGQVMRKDVGKGVFWYSSSNRGMNIIICVKCIEALYKSIPTEDFIHE